MSQADATKLAATVMVENIGGISETEVEIPPGVTVLTGRNATNRTSFLRAIMTAVGSNDVSLKGDADEGEVELTLDGETYNRTLQRGNDALQLDGNPFLDDSTVADLFAFLLESNEARRAVIRGDDLRELLMRPVDTDEIQAEIDRLERERDEVETKLNELDSLKGELPGLEEQKQQLQSDIEAKREDLEEIESEIDSMDADVDETREEKRELDSRLEDLRDLRADLESVRSDIDLEEESIASLRSERAELQEQKEELPDTPMGDAGHIEDEISRLREEKQQLEGTVRNLQDVIQFNEEMLDGEQSAVGETLKSDESDGAVTDQLLEEEEIVCWTCGSEVPEDRIQTTLDELRDVRQGYMADIREIEDDLDELRSDKREREKQQRRADEVQRKLDDIESEIEERESRLTDLRDRRNELSDEIETVEAEVEELESENFADILELHKEANQVEFELGQLESDLDDVTDRIAEIEDELTDESELRDRREALKSELEEQRTRIDQIERQAVEEFNDRMDDILDMLNYENLARIWIERVQKTVREGRRNVEKTVFELHVVRTTDSGATYEDTIDHLSESEREVTGLTFALAGYLVHDIHETVPFMMLDSLEAIDSERIADLVSYFSEYASYLVVALLPEDAQALSEEYTRVTDI
ncbi:archaea-specific SMC-related protein [Halorientalis marina]|jgi:chromosome segregation ATPase|uniref:archaea-specific SMC-related protein n=1 Tax=Halorientalis marina TaxID=2931976 RepID=UPI001FF5E790|nr:archaea-specific SMC-related protein [Halorientalis marina]